VNRYLELFPSLPPLNADQTLQRLPIMSFTTLGYPDKQRSLDAVRNLVEAGSDMLELGLPFTDPVADGPLLQEASRTALENGYRHEDALQIISDIRRSSDIPIGILCYANTVYRRGIQNFYRELADAGADSVLVADIPPEESSAIRKAARESGIAPVFLVTEKSRDQRLQRIAEYSRAFLYLVTRFGVTGTHSAPGQDLKKVIDRLRSVTALPVFTGFGISSSEDIQRMAEAGADAVIIGSAIVRLIQKHADSPEQLRSALFQFIRSLRNEL